LRPTRGVDAASTAIIREVPSASGRPGQGSAAAVPAKASAAMTSAPDRIFVTLRLSKSHLEAITFQDRACHGANDTMSDFAAMEKGLDCMLGC
jgi:hypothetical protein